MHQFDRSIRLAEADAKYAATWRGLSAAAGGAMVVPGSWVTLPSGRSARLLGLTCGMGNDSAAAVCGC